MQICRRTCNNNNNLSDKEKGIENQNLACNVMTVTNNDSLWHWEFHNGWTNCSFVSVVVCSAPTNRICINKCQLDVGASSSSSSSSSSTVNFKYNEAFTVHYMFNVTWIVYVQQQLWVSFIALHKSMEISRLGSLSRVVKPTKINNITSILNVLANLFIPMETRVYIFCNVTTMWHRFSNYFR